MWVLMTDGAVSIVKFNHATDERTLQVRSRRKEWLQSFAKLVGKQPSTGRMPKLIHSDDKDYQWRFFATPDEVALAMGRLALSIDYSNFKNATSDPKFGLKNAKLRNDLHDAYSKIWSTLLSYGDGTSVFNGKWSGTHADDAGTIGICARLGHWWSGKDKKNCSDCGTVNPDYPKVGQTMRPTKAEVEAWWKAHPEKKRPVAKDAKTTTTTTSYPASYAPFLTDAGTTSYPDSKWVKACKGSYMHGAKGTMATEQGVATAECIECGQRVKLTIDTWQIRMHDEVESVSDSADFDATVDEVDAVLDVPVDETSIEAMEAQRDAALDHLTELENLYAMDSSKVSAMEVDAAEREYVELSDAVIAAYTAQAVKESA